MLEREESLYRKTDDEIEDPNPLTDFLKLEDDNRARESYCFVVEKFIKQEKKISKRKY